jgi:hypothetical protein
MNYFHDLIDEDIIKKYKEEEIEKIPDNTLYHYTGIGGLKGIIGEWRLRLTEVSYLNDRKEYTDAFCILKRLCDRKLKDNDKYKTIFSLAIQGLENIEDIALFGSKLDKVFVFSLSTKKDDLNQWRSYASKGGYSIGFSFSTLDYMCQNQPGELYFLPCIYNDDQKTKIIESISNEILKDFDTDTSIDTLDEKIDIYAFRIKGEIMKLAPIFKNHHFQEEAEWRLIYIEKNQAPWFRCFERGNLLIPCFFVDFPLTIQNDFPFKSIHIGPLPMTEKMLAQHSTANFIRSIPHCLPKEVKSNHNSNLKGFEDLSHNIYSSEVPYRDNY